MVAGPGKLSGAQRAGLGATRPRAKASREVCVCCTSCACVHPLHQRTAARPHSPSVPWRIQKQLYPAALSRFCWSGVVSPLTMAAPFNTSAKEVPGRSVLVSMPPTMALGHHAGSASAILVIEFGYLLARATRRCGERGVHHYLCHSWLHAGAPVPKSGAAYTSGPMQPPTK
jgi:hypothetical protein